MDSGAAHRTVGRDEAVGQSKASRRHDDPRSDAIACSACWNWHSPRCLSYQHTSLGSCSRPATSGARRDRAVARCRVNPFIPIVLLWIGAFSGIARSSSKPRRRRLRLTVFANRVRREQPQVVRILRICTYGRRLRHPRRQEGAVNKGISAERAHIPPDGGRDFRPRCGPDA